MVGVCTRTRANFDVALKQVALTVFILLLVLVLTPAGHKTDEANNENTVRHFTFMIKFPRVIRFIVCQKKTEAALLH